MEETLQLAKYVCSLDYAAIPAEVLQMGKNCLLDSVAVGLHGSTKPWGKIVGALVKERGGKRVEFNFWRSRQGSVGLSRVGQWDDDPRV